VIIADRPALSHGRSRRRPALDHHPLRRPVGVDAVLDDLCGHHGPRSSPPCPAVEVKLIVFDTAIVDLSSEAHDPVEVLDVGPARRRHQYRRRQWNIAKRWSLSPRGRFFVLVSDFEEGGSVQRMAGLRPRRMASARVHACWALAR